MGIGPYDGLLSEGLDGKEKAMLEHPEIEWMERTGYPSWMQEKRPGSPWVEWEEEEPWED